jgi:hypothetical protein
MGFVTFDPSLEGIKGLKLKRMRGRSRERIRSMLLHGLWGASF